MMSSKPMPKFSLGYVLGTASAEDAFLAYSMAYEGRGAYLEMVKQGAHCDMISHHNGHHGEIDIVSGESRGTTITLRVPLGRG